MVASVDWNEGLARFFFFSSCVCAGQGEKESQKTWSRCQAEMTEIVEIGPHFFFFRV